jgi:hypothetical protein
MPLKTVVDAEGRRRQVRQRYDARSYTLPPDWIHNLRAHNKGYGARELLDERGGPFAGWSKIRELERGGKPFVLLMRNANDQWAIELELTDIELGEIRALPPEETWALARELDALATPPVEVED